jgi:peptidoglycan glycosyltransferase
MNQRIRHLTVALLVLFAVLFVQLTNLQVRQQSKLTHDSRNNRTSLRDFDAPRGSIVTADGVVIAETVKVDKKLHPNDKFQYQRVYPKGDLFANVTGYYTLGYGSTQLERLYNDVLSGKTAQQQAASAGNLFNKVDTTGSVHITLRYDLQLKAKEMLANREGSVVMLDPHTGAVLAMYSNPTFDPNLVASHDSNIAGNTLAALQADPRKPLLANAYQERYMPGSAFKIVTTTIGLETGILTPARVFNTEGAWVPPNTNNPIQNYGKKTCGGTLPDVFARSCNIPFARTAVEVGPDLFVNGVNKFGFGEKIPFDLPNGAASTFGGTAKEFSDSLALLAIHGFGEGSVQVVPLHMALLAATVANSGVMMRPYVVATTNMNTGVPMYTAQPQPWKTPMLTTTAQTLTQFMIGVVNFGTASCCMKLANGVQAAAKTGTAQLNPEGQKQRSHAWVTSFAPAEAPKVVATVMLKGVNDVISASTGGHLAGPVAKSLLDEALQRLP